MEIRFEPLPILAATLAELRRFCHCSIKPKFCHHLLSLMLFQTCMTFFSGT